MREYSLVITNLLSYHGYFKLPVEHRDTIISITFFSILAARYNLLILFRAKTVYNMYYQSLSAALFLLLISQERTKHKKSKS